MAAPDVPAVQEAVQEQAVAHRAGLVLGWLQGLKQNAAQSFREASCGMEGCGSASWRCGAATSTALVLLPTRRHPTPPDTAADLRACSLRLLPCHAAGQAMVRGAGPHRVCQARRHG